MIPESSEIEEVGRGGHGSDWAGCKNTLWNPQSKSSQCPWSPSKILHFSPLCGLHQTQQKIQLPNWYMKFPISQNHQNQKIKDLFNSKEQSLLRFMQEKH